MGRPAPAGHLAQLPARVARGEVVDDATLRFSFPGPDGLAIGKMRGFHIASKAFWEGLDAPGFGYKKFGLLRSAGNAC